MGITSKPSNQPQRQGRYDLEIENSLLRARLETWRIVSSIDTPAAAPGTKVALQFSATSQPTFEFDVARDTAFAHYHPAFQNVLHIFNAEYLGIRAAAGNLPGSKLAISVDSAPSGRALSDLIERIDLGSYERFVLHGHSLAMDVVARHIHKAFGKPIHGVWHGNFAQLVYHGEREAFERWHALMSEGIVCRAHILKQNASDFLERGYTPLLLNLPPKWGGRRISPAFADRNAVTAFLPGWLDVRKNWHANMLAAERAEGVHTLLCYTHAKPLFHAGRKTKHIAFDPITHMDVMASVDLVLNATLIDCHPMVDLEALACHTPAITSRLFLGDLDRHAYAQLTNVDNPSDTKAIADRIAVIANVSHEELIAMMDDYANDLVKTSVARYREFLQI